MTYPDPRIAFAAGHRTILKRATVLVVSLAAAFAAGCDKQSPAHLVLTLDGQPYPSDHQGGGFTGTGGPVIGLSMCVHPSTSSLAAVDDEVCQEFDVAGDLYQTLATPATLRVLATASIDDSLDGTFVPDTGHAPEIMGAFMSRNQNGVALQGVQTQRLDGTLELDYASATEYRGRVDIEVVGALPPVDHDVERQAHLSGAFTLLPE